MRLRSLIRGEAPAPIERPTPATLAIVATVEGILPKSRPSVATVATVATLPEPERWADIMRGLTVEGVRLDVAADALDSLMAADVVERALMLGWDARELIGLQRAKPHDHQARAGLVYSMRPADTVSSIHEAGCAILVAGNPVPHLWRRVSLTDSIFLPWTLT